MTPEIIVWIATASSVVTAGWWGADRRRARRRNREARCGACGGPLYAPGSHAGPSLVEGMLHCEPCAAGLRRRVNGAFAAAWAWSAGLLAVSAGGVLASGVAFLPVAGMLVGEAALVGGGTFAFMRRKNRLALRAMERRGEIILPRIPGGHA